MPPQKEIIRLLPGDALSLLPPGDKAAPGSLELSNWRVDQSGVLRSRRGLTEEAAGFGGPFHTLFRWDTQRYGITGTNLHKGAAMGTFLAGGFSGEPCTMLAYQGLTWIMDRDKPSKTDGDDVRNWSIDPPTAAPTVTAGGQVKQAVASFDDTEAWELLSPLGTDAYVIQTKREQISAVGTVDVTDGSATITGTGTAFTVGMVGKDIAIYNGSQSNYSVIATVASATSLTIIVPIVGSGSDLTYEITDDETASTPTKEFNDTNKVEGGHSLQINGAVVGRWTARLEGVSKDTRISGGAPRGDDQFRFQFYASDPDAITSIEVMLLNGGGDSRSFMLAQIPISALSQARYHWQELSISRGINAQNDLFADSVYAELNRQYDYHISQNDQASSALILERMAARSAELRALQVAFAGSFNFNWTAVTEVQISFQLVSGCTIHLDEAYFVGGVASSLNGGFSYAISYDNDWGHESAIGPYSSAVTLDKQGAALASIPVSADAQVTAKHVYRIGGGVNAPLRVATLAAATTTWTDAIPVETQQLNGIQAQIETDPAPEAWGAIQHLGRIVAWKGSRLYWSEVAKPWSFPGSGDDFEGNWIDVGEDGEDIVTCTSHANQLRIFKTKTIWRVLGDVDGADPEPTSAGFGALGIRGVVEAGAVDYFVAGEGVFVFNGDDSRKVSQPIDPLWKDDYVFLATGSLRTPANLDALDKAALGYINGRLYVSYPEAGQATPNRTLVLDVESGRWFDHSGGFRCFFYEGQGNTLLGGTQAGAVVSLEQGLLDGAAAIPLRWRTAYLDQGAPDNLKRYEDLVIEFQTAFGGETGPATLNVSLCLDNGATVIALGTISSATRTTKTFSKALADADWQGKNFSILVEGSTAKTCMIYAAYLHYTIQPRRGCSFDTGTIDLGSRLLKEVEAIEFDFDAEASTTMAWDLSTDWPGGAMAVRASAASTAIPAGRATTTVSMSAEGRRLRFRYTSPGCPQLYGVRLKYKSKGELIEPGQVWRSPVVDLRELNLFGAVEIVADTNGQVAFAQLSELPNYDLQNRNTLSFDTTTTGRAPIMIPLSHGTRGKLLQVVLTPGASILRLFSVRVWARNFDKSSGGGAWRWLTLFSAPETVGAGEDSKWADIEVRN
jgi:hypothetical protein